MQNAGKEKTKVKRKLVSFGWEPRNQVSEGAKSQRSPPTQTGKANLRTAAAAEKHMAAAVTKIPLPFSL